MDKKMTPEEAREYIKNNMFEVNGVKYTFAGLCAHYAIKYISVYKRVVDRGMDINDAIQECIQNPRTWGTTYYDGTMGGGVYGPKDNYKTSD